MADATPHQDDEVVAARLGGLARSLDGSVTAGADSVARERMRRALSSRSTSRFTRLPVVATGGLLVAAAAVVLMVWTRSPEPAVGYQMSGGSMRIAHDWMQVPPDREPGLLAFSEGTQITLAPGSESRVTRSDAQGAQVVLRTGRLRARVVHRTQTRWLITAGPYEVHVVGTELSVEWQAAEQQLEVQLHEGRVIVRGPSLSEGISVTGGQRLVAHAKTGNAELSSIAPKPTLVAEPALDAEPVVEAPPPTASLSPTPPSRSSAPTSQWSELIARGDFREVLALAAARGVETTLKRASLPELIAFTDAARYAGERELARRGLLAQRARFVARPEAKLAAFLLGRLADDAGAPKDALRWYDRYLREAPQGAFAAEALGRKLVALVGTGDVPAARGVAQDYLRRFVDGAHAGYAREVLQRQ